MANFMGSAYLEPRMKDRPSIQERLPLVTARQYACSHEISFSSQADLIPAKAHTIAESGDADFAAFGCPFMANLSRMFDRHPAREKHMVTLTIPLPLG